MFSLKASRFYVSYNSDSGEHQVFLRDRNGYHEVTKTLSDEDKEELINDLVYAVSDLLKEKERKNKCTE